MAPTRSTTPADNLGFVRRSTQESLEACRAVVEILEADHTYLNQSPKGGPALGEARPLQPDRRVGGPVDRLAMLWVLNLSDGSHSLLDVAERSGLVLAAISDAARSLERPAFSRPDPSEAGGARGNAPNAVRCAGRSARYRQPQRRPATRPPGDDRHLGGRGSTSVGCTNVASRSTIDAIRQAPDQSTRREGIRSS